MSESRNWKVINMATGDVVAHGYDESRDDMLEWIAETFGRDWAYGTAEFPARFRLEPCEDPNG